MVILANDTWAHDFDINSLEYVKKIDIYVKKWLLCQSGVHKHRFNFVRLLTNVC